MWKVTFDITREVTKDSYRFHDEELATFDRFSERKYDTSTQHKNKVANSNIL